MLVKQLNKKMIGIVIKKKVLDDIIGQEQEQEQEQDSDIDTLKEIELELEHT